jgi:hypothetical protein
LPIRSARFEVWELEAAAGQEEGGTSTMRSAASA